MTLKQAPFCIPNLNKSFSNHHAIQRRLSNEKGSAMGEAVEQKLGILVLKYPSKLNTKLSHSSHLGEVRSRGHLEV